MPTSLRRRALLVAALITPAIGATAQTFTILSYKESLPLEHRTRYQRIYRLAQTFGVSSQPELRDYIVPAEAMPPGFPYDVPVLRIIFPESTFFDTASDDLKPEAVPIIRTMAAVLDGDVPDVTVFVAGHTDSRGAPIYNHNLSVRRAHNVATLLNNLRARPGPILSIGFGESVPLYPNSSSENLARNRRVEFLLAARIEAVAIWLQDQSIDVCRSTQPVERLRCLVEFKREPKTFVAMRVDAPRPVRPEPPESPVRVSPRPVPRPRITPEGGGVAKVDPAGPNSIRIQLNESPVFVRGIEH